MAGDLKRGGCKYVRSFASAATRLREAGSTAARSHPDPYPYPHPHPLPRPLP